MRQLSSLRKQGPITTDVGCESELELQPSQNKRLWLWVPARAALGRDDVELLRRHLARCRRRVDEVGGELLVARLGVLYRLLLHRAVAADAIRQREYFYGGVVRGLRQQVEYGGDVLLVACDQVALQLAVGAVAEHVERRAAKEAEFGEHAEYAHHPGTES